MSERIGSRVQVLHHGRASGGRLHIANFLIKAATTAIIWIRKNGGRRGGVG